MRTEARKDVHRIFIEERELIDEALQRGVRDAVLRHKRDGLPMVIYRDGKTVWVKPEDLSL
ncbi:MAG TPA: hypothetical protein VIK60_16620 [Vicinamibacterales bacterium]